MRQKNGFVHFVKISRVRNVFHVTLLCRNVRVIMPTCVYMPSVAHYLHRDRLWNAFKVETDRNSASVSASAPKVGYSVVFRRSFGFGRRKITNFRPPFGFGRNLKITFGRSLI